MLCRYIHLSVCSVNYLPGFRSAAINECDPKDPQHNCEQICVKQKIGFTCACEDGYRLKNNKTCSGKRTQAENELSEKKQQTLQLSIPSIMQLRIIYKELVIYE